MTGAALADSLWVVLAVASVLGVADVVVRWQHAALLRPGAQSHVLSEAPPPPPGRARSATRVVLAQLLWIWLGLPVIYFLWRRIAWWTWPMIAGLLVLGTAVALATNASSLVGLRYAAASSGVAGSIRYSYACSVQAATSRLLGWAALLGIAAWLTASPFVAGGALACVVAAARIRLRRAPRAQAADETSPDALPNG
jgi:hypothetical protein